MKNEFKAGDLVFETLINGEMLLTKLSARGDYVCTRHASYNHYGINEQTPICQLLHATPENRQALVTLYGEDAVPKLPLSPQEITLKLLENQKYQLCRVSNHSTDWKHNKNLKAIVHIGVFGEFLDSNGEGWTYGIPVDNNGNEITEIE